MENFSRELKIDQSGISKLQCFDMFCNVVQHCKTEIQTCFNPDHGSHVLKLSIVKDITFPCEW